MTSMRAVVLEQEGPCRLLVRDCRTCQEVLVNTDQAADFSEGDQVGIRYSGAMTMSLPPQVSALCISRVCR